MWYSVARLALLAACAVGLWLVGLHPVAAVVAGALVAWGVSYVVLSRPRDAAARYLAARAGRRRRGETTGLAARIRDDAAAEDAAAARAVDVAQAESRPDAAQSASPSPSSTP